MLTVIWAVPSAVKVGNKYPIRFILLPPSRSKLGFGLTHQPTGARGEIEVRLHVFGVCSALCQPKQFLRVFL